MRRRFVCCYSFRVYPKCQNGRFGLKPAHADEPHAVLVRIRHEKSNRVVRSRPFLRENGIKIDRTLRFPYSFLENDVLILDLRAAVTCGKGAWKSIKPIHG